MTTKSIKSCSGRTGCSPILPPARSSQCPRRPSPTPSRRSRSARRHAVSPSSTRRSARGRFAADEGTLLALVGGKPDVVERGRAVYGCFCSDYAHLGEVGHGQVGKTMNNLLLWINAVGLIEAGRLAETTGI